MSEVELCKPIIEWLQDYGWDVYQEVQLKTYGPVCDIVGVKRDPILIWGIEAKQNFSLQLLEKSVAWDGTFNYTSITYPRERSARTKGPGDRYPRLLRLVTEQWGIGMIEVDVGRWIVDPTPATISERWAPRLRRIPKTTQERVLAIIDENHKDFAPAGTASGKRWTPFQSTCKQLRKYVTAHGPVELGVLINSVEHHYKTPQSARSSVRHWIKAGKIDGLTIVRRYGATLVELAPNEPPEGEKCLDEIF